MVVVVVSEDEKDDQDLDNRESSLGVRRTHDEL